MNDTPSKWWWVPSALMTLAGTLFLVAATYGNAGIWVAIAVIWFIVAGMNYRRRRSLGRPDSD